MSLGERDRLESAVRRLTNASAPLPDFSGFHPAFRDPERSEPTPEGDVRRAFYLSYDDSICEYLTAEEIDAAARRRRATWSRPPSSPPIRRDSRCSCPGQVFSREILSFMRSLDTPEVHGYKPDFGYRVYTAKAIEALDAPAVEEPNGYRSVPAEPSNSPAPIPTLN